MPPCRRIAVALLTIAVTATVAQADPVPTGSRPDPSLAGWQKVEDEDGIVIYRQDAEGLTTVSFRGEARIDARVTDIVDVMKNNAEAHEWMPLVVEKRDLQQISAFERIELTHIGMPWPLSDRYFVNQGKAEYLDGGVVRLSIRSVEQDPVQDTTKVLGVLHYSEFLLTPEDNGRRTHMTLEVNSDPKGLLPKWIVNAAQQSWPRDFFLGLIRQLEKHGKLGVAYR